MKNTAVFIIAYLAIFNFGYATTFTDILLNDEVSIKENSIIFFIDRTNCISCDLGLKELISESSKLKLKSYLVVVGNSSQTANEYAKSRNFEVVGLDDSKNNYSNEFKVKSTPSFFTVNFLGRIQKMGLIGKSDFDYIPLMPNRTHLTDLNVESDYFFTFSVDTNIFTYNATNNSIIKLNSLGKEVRNYKIKDPLIVVRNMFYYNNNLICIEYSPIKGTSILSLDGNLNKNKLIKLKIEDNRYMNDYSLGMHSFIDKDGFLYSAVRKYWDTTNVLYDIIKFNIDNGEIVDSYFSGDTTINTDLIIIKNMANNIEYLSENNPKLIYKYNGLKFEILNFSLEPLNKTDSYIIDAFFANNKYFWLIGFLEKGYGSISSRISYYIYVTDENFNFLTKCSLSKVYNNGPFVFLRFKDDSSIEILGKDDYGCFIEKVIL